jgi:hypothetical protein
MVMISFRLKIKTLKRGALLHLNSNYKGGRNESFMYGQIKIPIDKSRTRWLAWLGKAKGLARVRMA